MDNIFETKENLRAKIVLLEALVEKLELQVMDLTVALEQEQLINGAICEFCQYVDRTKQQELERELGYMCHDLAEANERLDLSRKDTDHALKLASYYKHLVKAQELKEDLGL